MNPWQILGWILIALISGYLLLVVGYFSLLLGALWWKARDKNLLHRRTRNIPPAKGQRWMQVEGVLVIEHVYENGNIGIRSGNASWGESQESWKNRVKNRKLHLIGPD